VGKVGHKDAQRPRSSCLAKPPELSRRPADGPSRRASAVSRGAPSATYPSYSVTVSSYFSVYLTRSSVILTLVIDVINVKMTLTCLMMRSHAPTTACIYVSGDQVDTLPCQALVSALDPAVCRRLRSQGLLPGFTRPAGGGLDRAARPRRHGGYRKNKEVGRGQGGAAGTATARLASCGLVNLVTGLGEIRPPRTLSGVFCPSPLTL
jgi:hypothetical protein